MEAVGNAHTSHAARLLPMLVRVSDAGIFTFRDEELTIEDVPPTVGAAVCVRSGSRLAFRRVLGIEGATLRLRADLAPFEDRWDGDAELVGANIHLVLGSQSYSAFTLVDRRFRGTGGGSKMIQRAVQVCRRQGLQSIYVHIDVRNFPSIAAYERNGFEKKGWWSDESDPLASAERRWKVLELELTR